MRNEKPFMVVTMGDAAGIGPEIALSSLQKYFPERSRAIIVGGYEIFLRAAAAVKSPLSLKRITNPDEGDYRPGIANILDMAEPDPRDVPFGQVSPLSGKSSVLAVHRAHEMSLNYPVRAIISAPLHKQAMKEAGFSFGDECDLMSSLTGASTPMMLLISEKMRMATLAPLHLPLKKACENVTAERVLSCLDVLHNTLISSFGIAKPSIAVAALNPHGGEGGMLGDEEQRHIIPAVGAAQKKGWNVSGPYPADSLFFKASKGDFDAVLTMYHDQGRIAMKTTDFGKIIITMIGIPVPFLTVAHGTGHDIAGKGKADPSNFVDLLQFADKLH